MPQDPNMSPAGDEEEAPAEEMQEMQTGEEPGEEPGEAGANRNKEIAKQALTYLYGDQKTYASMIDLMQKGKADMVNTIGNAAGIILDKVDQDKGLDMEQAQGVGILIVISMYELADKAGIAPEVGKDQIQQAFGIVFSNWAKKNPDRVDKEKLDAAMNSPEGQRIASEQKQQQPAPAQAKPQEAMGMLGAPQ